MKTALSLLMLAAACFTAAAQYSVDWYKISGGGGTSSGGNYSVSGTIGQHDAAGELTGGSYSLTGGFWALYAVQTPGAPTLTIYHSSANTAVVAWPVTGSSGFVLQETSTLGTPNWVKSSDTVSVSSGTNQITVSSPAGNKFYRLYHP